MAYSLELDTHHFVRRPEDYGAVGDGTTDDYDALNAFFNGYASVTGIEDSISLALTPGKTYLFDTPITITGGTTGANFKMNLQGNGAVLKYTGGASKGYALRIGDYTNTKKMFWSRWSDFELQEENDGDGGLLLDYGDFCVFENLRCIGDYSGAAIKVQNNNSLTFIDVNTGGADTGVLFGDIVNVFKWLGGKVQQHDIGIHYKGSVFSIEQVDISLCDEIGLKLEDAGAGRIHLYTEAIGPGTAANTAKVVLLDNVHSTIIGGAVNATNGTNSSRTHAQWAIKCENGCTDITIEASGTCPQQAFVEASSDCRNIYVAPMANSAANAADERTQGPLIPGTDPQVIYAPRATFLRNKSDSAAPTSLLPDLLSDWTIGANSGVLTGTYDDFEETGTAQAVEFTDNVSTASFSNSLSVTAGETYRLEGRTRLLAFDQPTQSSRVDGDMAMLRVRFWDGTTGFETNVRQGDQWQDWYYDVIVPAGKTSITVMLICRTNWEAFDMLVDFVRGHKIS